MGHSASGIMERMLLTRISEWGCRVSQHQSHHQLHSSCDGERKQMRRVDGLCSFSYTEDRESFLGENCVFNVWLNFCCITVIAIVKVCISDCVRCYPGFTNPETIFANTSIVLELQQRCDSLTLLNVFQDLLGLRSSSRQ